MKKQVVLQLIFFIMAIIALSKSSNAQSIRFEVSIPGIHIVVGEPYPVVIPQPTIIYYEPLPRGYYYYDRCNDVFYDDYGNVYYSPSNVYYDHDNGKHKGWYKKKHKHKEFKYERDDD